MRILAVIPARHWVNLRNGRTASVYGALPYTSNAEKADWEVQENGWTWQNDNGTIGLGRVPAKTREEAEEVMRKNNARIDENRLRYAQPVKTFEQVLAASQKKGKGRRAHKAVSAAVSLPPGTTRG